MEFIYLYLFGIAGWIIAVLASFETYNQAQLKIEKRWDTYKEYFHKYLTFIITSFILVTVVSIFASMDILKYLLDIIGFFKIDEKVDMNKLNPILVFFISFNIETTINIIRRFKKPLTADYVENKIQVPGN